MSDLVEVRFLPDDRTAWVRSGATLLEAATAAGVDVATGCEEGMCGTDVVKIVSGVEGLEPPGDDELGTIERIGLEGDWRLACSARLKSGRLEIDVAAF